MRHVTSFVISPIIAAAIYVLIGVANVKAATGLGQVDDHRSRGYVNLGIAVGCLAVAGGLYAILVLGRLSPLGTVVAGLALLGVGGWAWFAHQSFLDRMPSGIPGVRGAGHAGAGATTIALSIPLILTLFSARRWRRYANRQQIAPPPGYAGSPTYPDGPGGPGYPGGPDGLGGLLVPGTSPVSGAPVYDPPTYAPPSYGSTRTATESYPSSSSTTTDLFGNSRYP